MCILIEVKLGCMKYIWASVLAVPEAVQWSWFLRYVAKLFGCIYNAKWYVMLIGKEKYCWKYRPLQCTRAKYFLKGLKKMVKNLSQLSPFLTGSEKLASRKWIRNSNYVKALFKNFVRVPKDYTSQINTDCAPHIYLIMLHCSRAVDWFYFNFPERGNLIVK